MRFYQHPSFIDCNVMGPKIKQIFWISSAALMVILPLCLIPIARSLDASDKLIRVLVVKDVSNVSLSVQGSWTLLDESSGQVLDQGDRTLFTDVKVLRGGISFDGKVF